MTKTKRRSLPCANCGGRATWKQDENGHGEYVCQNCGIYVDLETVDDGRIRSAADVPIRVAGARAARDADPIFKGRQILYELFELYCEIVEKETWVTILAADTWAAQELTKRLGRNVFRQQVARQRHALVALGYIRCLRPDEVRRTQLKQKIQEYKLRGMKPPIIVEVLKARKGER